MTTQQSLCSQSGSARPTADNSETKAFRPTDNGIVEGPSLFQQLQEMQQEMQHLKEGRRDQTIVYQEKDNEVKIFALPEPKMYKGKNYRASYNFYEGLDHYI